MISYLSTYFLFKSLFNIHNNQAYTYFPWTLIWKRRIHFSLTAWNRHAIRSIFIRFEFKELSRHPSLLSFHSHALCRQHLRIYITEITCSLLFHLLVLNCIADKYNATHTVVNVSHQRVHPSLFVLRESSTDTISLKTNAHHDYIHPPPFIVGNSQDDTSWKHSKSCNNFKPMNHIIFHSSSTGNSIPIDLARISLLTESIRSWRG